MDLVKVLSEQQLKSDLPELKIGDTVRVHAKIKEGNRERIQVFEGIIIAMKHAGVNKSVTVALTKSCNGRFFSRFLN